MRQFFSEHTQKGNRKINLYPWQQNLFLQKKILALPYTKKSIVTDMLSTVKQEAYY